MRVLPDGAIEVLDHGFVRLDDAMADDLSVVNGARVSFARRKEEMDESDAGLVRFLMRDRHGTPFEHNSFRFHVRAPIFVAREWFRHRVGSFNEFSMRYARATDDFYLPEPEDVRTQVGKPGSYSFDPVTSEIAETTREELANVYETAYATYERLVEPRDHRPVRRLGSEKQSGGGDDHGGQEGLTKWICAAGPRCSPRGRVLSRPNAEEHWGSLRPCLGTTIASRQRVNSAKPS